LRCGSVWEADPPSPPPSIPTSGMGSRRCGRGWPGPAPSPSGAPPSRGTARPRSHVPGPGLSLRRMAPPPGGGPVQPAVASQPAALCQPGGQFPPPKQHPRDRCQHYAGCLPVVWCGPRLHPNGNNRRLCTKHLSCHTYSRSLVPKAVRQNLSSTRKERFPIMGFIAAFLTSFSIPQKVMCFHCARTGRRFDIPPR